MRIPAATRDVRPSEKGLGPGRNRGSPRFEARSATKETVREASPDGGSIVFFLRRRAFDEGPVRADRPVWPETGVAGDFGPRRRPERGPSS